ncbi:MAG: butyrate kinase [Spiroplasma sp.]|nr:butyrate kinase [Mycoplasmatales bacterium]
MILVINPGSTSTKVAIFDNILNKLFEENLSHSVEELEQYPNIVDQKKLRFDKINDFLAKNKIELTSFEIIVGRGGLVKPIAGGTYEVTPELLKDLKIGVQGQHASNLGGIIAHEIAQKINKKAYIVNPVVVDEFTDIARVSGLSEYPRRSLFHALNQKAILIKFCSDHNKDISNLSTIIAHLGGGITVGYHCNNRTIDVNNGLGGEGPLSPERCGTISPYTVFKLLDDYGLSETKKKLTGKGGLVDLLGTNDVREVQKMIDEGNEDAKLALDAMCYQVAKQIGAFSIIEQGKVEAILITGGVAHSKYVTDKISSYVKHIAEVFVYPGENEILALAEAGQRVLLNQEVLQKY